MFTTRSTFHRPGIRRLVTAAVLGLCLTAGGAGTLLADPLLIQGTTGEGALYEFAVPDNWNGVLAVYAHGMVSPFLPIALPGGGFTAFRNALLAEGVAVAYSSFSENGFAVKDGEQRTHQLLGLFQSKVGKPSRVYIMGHSLGGAIAMGLAEKYPSQYDGALPMCGFLGGTAPEIEYLANVRVLFDAIFPGVVPGDQFDIPISVALNPAPTLVSVQNALIAGLATGKTQQLFACANVPGLSLAEKLQSVITAIGFNLIFTNDLIARTHGHIPIDNTTTDYCAAGFDEIDAVVERFSSSPDAVNYIRHYETPTGDLRNPMVTLHTTRDPVVPIFHQPLYQEVVNAAGTSALLRQRSVVRYGHCAFTVAEMLQAFGELRAWVEQGVVPSL
jgi:pimeloyl-ACP methyl ester carboxylesterase